MQDKCHIVAVQKKSLLMIVISFGFAWSEKVRELRKFYDKGKFSLI